VLLDVADCDEDKGKELLTPINQNRFVHHLEIPSEWDFQVVDKDKRLGMEFDLGYKAQWNVYVLQRINVLMASTTLCGVG
jgi:hypothetical protein